MEKFDSDLNLLGFEDGIYDLKENVFREGRPEDYITMSTKVKLHIPNNELPIELNKLQDKFNWPHFFNVSTGKSQHERTQIEN